MRRIAFVFLLLLLFAWIGTVSNVAYLIAQRPGGDAVEAQRQAKQAGDLLNDPPLTLLLEAQAAQLGGDEKAATRYFRAMLDHPEASFLGLRGLLMQSLKTG